MREEPLSIPTKPRRGMRCLLWIVCALLITWLTLLALVYGFSWLVEWIWEWWSGPGDS